MSERFRSKELEQHITQLVASLLIKNTSWKLTGLDSGEHNLIKLGLRDETSGELWDMAHIEIIVTTPKPVDLKEME